MTIDSFLAMKTLPGAGDLMALCDHLGIEFVQSEKTGRPSLKPNGLWNEANAIAVVLGREPWRSQVLEAKKLEDLKATPIDDRIDARCSVCDVQLEVFRICTQCGKRWCLCGKTTPSTFDELCAKCEARIR